MSKPLIFSLVALFALFFTSCQKEVSVENAVSVVAAKASLYDTSGNCMPSTVHGAYYNGVNSGDTSYVDVQVRVDSVGSYTIATSDFHGLSFSGSGVFSSTGLVTVRLNAVGASTAAGVADFALNFDTSFCGFTIQIQDSTGTGLGGNNNNNGGGNNGGSNGGENGGTIAAKSWRLTDSTNGKNYSGQLPNGVFSNLLGPTLVLPGFGPNGGSDQTLILSVSFDGNTIQTGSYETGITTLFNFQAAPVAYATNFFTQDPVVINITSYNSSTKVVQGTFSGNAEDASGNVVRITNGAFNTVVQQ